MAKSFINVKSGGSSSNNSSKTGTGTITTTGWITNTGDYAYKLNIAITGILETDVVAILIDKDSQNIATISELSSSIDSYNGGITVYAKSIPTEELLFTYATVVSSGSNSANSISYDNTASGLASDKVQGAIDELFQSGNDGKTLLETTLIAKNSMVSKIGSIATFNELNEAINLLPSLSNATYLYNQGEEYVTLTGGWIAVAAKDSRYNSVPTTPSLTKNADNMYFTLTAGGSTSGSTHLQGCIATNNTIDLTNYTKLSIVYKGTLEAYSASSILEIVTGTISDSIFVNSASAILVYSTAVIGYVQVDLDITSLTGVYKILINVQAGSGYTVSGNCTLIWLE